MAGIVDPFKAKPAGIVDPFKKATAAELVAGQKADPSKDGDLFFTEDTDVPIDMSGVDPVRKGRVREALKALQIRRGGMTDTPSGRMFNSAFLGLPGLAESTIRADLTYAKEKGKGKLPYTVADMRDAERLAARARRGEYQGKHPVVAPVLDVTGSLLMPGGKQIADWTIGKVAPAAYAAGKSVPVGERVLQAGRMGVTGGALTGITAGAQAAPGEEAASAQSGALTGAVLTPMVGGVAGMGIAAARRAPRLGARIIGRGPNAEVTAVEKLQTALQRAGATPDILNKVADDWAKMGGVDPATIDLLRDANVTPEVLRLLQRSASRVESRAMAADYAKNTVDNVQPTATAQAEKLPTGAETRTPTQIRADLAAEEARIADDLAKSNRDAARLGDVKGTTVARRGEQQLSEIDRTEAERLAQIETDKVAATPVAPPAPLARESGAATFADDLNRLYDTSEKVYKDAYAAAEKAKPEAAIVADTEVRPLFDKLKVPQTFDEALPGVAAVKKYLGEKKNRIAPGETSDWPEGEPMENAAPLTMLDLQKMRQVLTHYGNKYADEPGGALAMRLKAELDGEIDRLATENKISGDPKIVDLWKTAIGGAKEYFTKFGEGLPAKLTARKVDGSREVPSHMAGDVIFSSPNQIGLNKSLNELGGSLDLVSPESIRALQEELYGRVELSDLPALRETTGGKRLLPEDLTEAALKVPPGAQAADEAAAQAAAAVKETAKTLREGATTTTEARKTQVELNALARQDRAAADAAARRAPLGASESALGLGEEVLSRPTEEFAPAVGGVDEVNLGLTSTGAKQAVLDAIEGKAPGGKQPFNQMFSQRAMQNLERAVGPEAGTLRQRLDAIQRQAQNAQTLEKVVTKESSRNTSPLLENVTGANVVYRSGWVNEILDAVRKSAHLSDKEYQAALGVLTSKDPAAKQRLLDGLLKKYPKAKRAIAPILTKALVQPSDAGAVDALEEGYGVTTEP